MITWVQTMRQMKWFECAVAAPLLVGGASVTAAPKECSHMVTYMAPGPARSWQCCLSIATPPLQAAKLDTVAKMSRANRTRAFSLQGQTCAFPSELPPSRRRAWDLLASVSTCGPVQAVFDYSACYCIKSCGVLGPQYDCRSCGLPGSALPPWGTSIVYGQPYQLSETWAACPGQLSTCP